MPGQLYDPETGFHYNGFRYYDPRTGRYLRADPIGQLGGLNLYAYVENNPPNLTDFEGLHGPIILLKSPPYFYRIPILRNILRIPPKGLPKETPVIPRRVFPERSPSLEDLGGPPDDLWWQQDPFPPKPPPYNPNKPMIPIVPNIDPIKMRPDDDPCEKMKKEPIPWDKIPLWMKA